MIEKYFKNLSALQTEQFDKLGGLYREWNDKINVISRKDIESLEEKHILHSLSIAKLISFKDGTDILDVGTGGGFPGIPLAIMFPNCNFVLVDSIGKKINVVRSVADALELQNVSAINMRVENIKKDFDFIVSRAVTELPVLYTWVQNKFKKENLNTLKNGFIYLKGGEVQSDMEFFKKRISVFDIKNYFEEEFFETKKIIYIS